MEAGLHCQEGLYTQCDGSVMDGRDWLGRFVRGAYLEEPTILQIVAGLNTYDQSSIGSSCGEPMLG